MSGKVTHVSVCEEKPWRTQVGFALDAGDENAERLQQLHLDLLTGLLRQDVEEVRQHVLLQEITGDARE